MKAYDKYIPKELGTARVNLLIPLTFFNDGGKTTTDCVSVNGQCYGPYGSVIIDSDIMVAIVLTFFSL